MELSSVIKLKYGSLRNFSKQNSIPYSTLYDLCCGKKELMDCNGRTLWKLAIGLDTTVDNLLRGEPFQSFRDNLHHQYVKWGSLQFLIHYLERNEVARLWKNGQSIRALYLLAMLDTICENEELPFAAEYDDLRSYSLEAPFFVGDSVFNIDLAKQNALPQFIKYNIIEGSIDDAV